MFDVPPSELVRAEAAVETNAPETNDAGARSDAGAIFVCKTIAVTAWLVVSLALLIRHGRAFSVTEAIAETQRVGKLDDPRSLRPDGPRPSSEVAASRLQSVLRESVPVGRMESSHSFVQ